MNQEIKIKWLEALRSGKYQQGEGQLRTQDNKFCCLGVLCDIVKPEGWSDVNHDEWWHDGESGVLGHEVVALAGIERIGTLSKPIEYPPQDHPGDPNKMATALSALNDRGMTFEEIAKVIEEQL